MPKRIRGKKKPKGIIATDKFGYIDLTPTNAIRLINGGKVEDITLGDNHIYGSVHELGKRLPGSM